MLHSPFALGRHRAAAAVLAAASLCCGCSTVPPDHWPERRDVSIRLLYRLRDPSLGAPFPQSHAGFEVLTLNTDPATAEVFRPHVQGRERFLVPTTAGADQVIVEAELRVSLDPDSGWPDWPLVFADATILMIEERDSPPAKR